MLSSTFELLNQKIMKTLLLFPAIILFYANTFAQTSSNEVTPADQYQRAITIQPFSPVTGSLKFNYNQVLQKNVTLDLGVGIIGPNVSDDYINNKGVSLKAGAKLYFNPDYYSDGLKKYSDFQGGYFEPEVAVVYFIAPSEYEQGKDAYAGTALLLNVGKQKVVGKRVLLDYWIGAGYGVNIFEEGYSGDYKHEYLRFNELGIALTCGFSVGILTN